MGANAFISSPLEGILNTSKLYRATLSKALSEGIDIINGCKIQNIERDGDGFRMDFDFGFFEAKEVMIAANAFAKDLIPNIDVQPSVNRVLVTEEIQGLKFIGSCHYDRGYVYLRRIGNRMLIGGGRQWGDGDSKEVENKLKSFLYQHIEGTSEAQIEYNWIGILVSVHQETPL